MELGSRAAEPRAATELSSRAEEPCAAAIHEPSASAEAGAGEQSAKESALDAALEHAAHLLPAQGPIGNFIHHNTLHAFQQLPFHQALRAASDVYDTEGYLSEEQYREALRTGRISEDDLRYAYAQRALEVSDEHVGPIQRHQLEYLLLEHGLSEGELAEALCELPEADRELFAACQRLAPSDVPWYAELLARVGRDRTARDLLIALGARDPNELSNPALIDFLGAYLDEGMARWSMPGREQGLLACFHAYLAVSPGSLPAFQQRTLARLERARSPAQNPRPARAHSQYLNATELALSALDELGVVAHDYEAYLSRVLLELPGWTGMVARLEHVPADRGPGAPPVSLLQLAAIRLLLDLEAYAECARATGHTGRPAELPAFAARRLALEPSSNEVNASRLFDVCELAEIQSASQLLALGTPFAERACALVAEFGLDIRRRLLHEAYEHAHLREVLDAVITNREASFGEEGPKPVQPRFQALFCIDDREESIRRYFEELHPGHVSYGVAGFFGVAMSFRGLDDATSSSLCPIVVNPAHAIEEAPLPDHQESSARRFLRRNVAARVRYELADSSRSLVRGAALTPLLGTLAAVPLTLSVLFPRLSALVSRWIAERALPTPRTQLTLERSDEAKGIEGTLARGFTIAEQADRVASTLENIGLVRDFAPLVAVLGHGASTVNNPHHSAYDCGACGGRNGGPNGRAFAAMANSPAVRTLLRLRNIEIPDTTWFVGGFHDTTTDGVHLADLELVPPAFAKDFAELHAALDAARAMSALERCRKFEHAPARLTPRAALRHVEERAVDLSQARPELGHATNAVCIVGRRDLSRQLFLDRRAFLVSYSADIDPDLRILERILGAVVPVGAGINLEYYFSTVDNNVYGCGTKLPHNLACLLGVMEGSCGDLRTGLPRQMIEIHDPVRLLSIIEATPEAILEVAARKPEVAELVTREWVRVASVDPQTGAMQVFEGGQFRPYTPSSLQLHTVSSAEHWYRGQLGFLSPVRIVKERNRAA